MSTARSLDQENDRDARDRLSLRAWLHLMKCAKVIEGAVGARMRRKYGQSLGRYDVLSQLYRFDGDWLPIGHLAGHLMAASGNITALIDRMESEGLVERRPSPSDRRSSQVRLSANGRALFLTMTEDHAAWVDQALDGVDDADKQALIDLLSTTRKAFERAVGESGASLDEEAPAPPPSGKQGNRRR
jgi:DNA-binding MarR family transcriptional regulator